MFLIICFRVWWIVSCYGICMLAAGRKINIRNNISKASTVYDCKHCLISDLSLGIAINEKVQFG